MKNIFFDGKGQKFLNFLKDGKKITRSQASKKWDMGNPSAWILRFEEEGYAVKREYAHAGKKNRRTVTYSLIWNMKWIKT